MLVEAEQPYIASISVSTIVVYHFCDTKTLFQYILNFDSLFDYLILCYPTILVCLVSLGFWIIGYSFAI